MRLSRETTAWAVLWGAFLAFCVLVLGGVLGAFTYVNSAKDSHSSRVTIISGTVLVRPENSDTWVSATPDMELDAGDSVRTDETSQAMVFLFDGSTVRLFPGTEVILKQTSSARYREHREFLALRLESGSVRIGVAPTVHSEKRFRVRTAEATIELAEGSFSLRADESLTSVRVREVGSAVVVAHGEELIIGPQQRTEVLAGEAPGQPSSGGEELLVNGDFSRGLEGWQEGAAIGFPEGQDVSGEIGVVTEEGSPAVRFLRKGSRNFHCENYIVQALDRDVSDFSDLHLTLRFKLLDQTLSGGGYQGSEYPLLVRVDYQTARGSNFKVFGFYYQNKANNRTDNGTLVEQGKWVEVTLPENLMTLAPAPRVITSVQASASGWDYESLLSSISLVGE